MQDGNRPKTLLYAGPISLLGKVISDVEKFEAGSDPKAEPTPKPSILPEHID